MKNLLLLLTTGIVFACTTPQKAQESTAKAVAPQAAPAFVQWDKTMVELGQVRKGEKRSMTYTFTNTSTEVVQIEIVDACDCTTIDFPRGAIEPGKTGRLDVVFDSHEKEESETIEMRIIFKNTDARGYPRIELLKYHFDLLK